jgi:flagellar biosynthetic protein FliQ
MDTVQAATELGRRALMIAMQLSLPVLAVGLVVGLLVSLIQAITQIQEQTLSFIPKIFAMAGAVFVFLPWFLSVMTSYMSETLASLGSAALP